MCAHANCERVHTHMHLQDSETEDGGTVGDTSGEIPV